LPKASSHFWWLPTSLSIVLSTLGILALAQHAFVTWSLSAPLALVMAAYNATMQLLFGWAHPYLQAALTWLGSFIGWRPTLYPHWKDVFVVVSLIGIGAGRAFWPPLQNIRDVWLMRGMPDWGPGPDPLFSMTPIVKNATIGIGPILGAAVTALAAGTLPLQSPDLITQFLIAGSLGLTFLILFVVMVSGESVWLIGLIVASGTSALAALATWLLSLVVGHAGGLGLAGLACVVVLFGLFLVSAEVFLQSEDGGPTEPQFLWWGLTILGGFVGAAFVFAVDAGLKLLGA